MRVYIDTETTGLRPGGYAKVIEVAAGIYGENWEEISVFSSLANPGREFLGPGIDQALDINGITREEILEAPPLVEVAQEFRIWLTSARDAAYHSYNRAFDSGHLEVEPWNIPLAAWGECVMLAAAKAMDQRRWPKLRAAAEHFGLEFPVQHRALPDMRMAAQVHRHVLWGRV